MKEFLKKDLTLKIFSIVFAVALWFTINPVKTGSYTVPLNVINEESLRDKGLVLNSKAYQKPVVITVRDRGDVLNAIKDSDFEVTLDLSKVNSVEDEVVELDPPLYIGREKINLNTIDMKPKSVTLDLGKIEENPFIVQVETSGKLPAGYEIISKTADPETVSIEALDSLLSSVGSVKVYVDVTGLNKTLEVRKECKVYNKKGEEMPELAKKLTVDVRIEVGKRVPVVPITSGVPAKDFVEGAYTVNPDNILITGDLATMTNVKDIKTEPVNIENVSKTFTKQVLLQLPDGVKLVNSSREVGVTVEIIPLKERIMEIPIENITIEGKSTDPLLNYVITPPVSLKIKGKIEDLNAITLEQLLAKIDVAGLGEGDHNVPLKVTLPGNVTQVEEVSVPVKITAAEAADTSESSDTSG